MKYSSNESWWIFLKRFVASVQHIVGEVEVKIPNESDTRLEEELEALRFQVEKLSDEVSQCINTSYEAFKCFSVKSFIKSWTNNLPKSIP